MTKYIQFIVCALTCVPVIFSRGGEIPTPESSKGSDHSGFSGECRTLVDEISTLDRSVASWQAIENRLIRLEAAMLLAEDEAQAQAMDADSSLNLFYALLLKLRTFPPAKVVPYYENVYAEARNSLVKTYILYSLRWRGLAEELRDSGHTTGIIVSATEANDQLTAEAALVLARDLNEVGCLPKDLMFSRLIDEVLHSNKPGSVRLLALRFAQDTGIEIDDYIDEIFGLLHCRESAPIHPESYSGVSQVRTVLLTFLTPQRKPWILPLVRSAVAQNGNGGNPAPLSPNSTTLPSFADLLLADRTFEVKCAEIMALSGDIEAFAVLRSYAELPGFAFFPPWLADHESLRACWPENVLKALTKGGNEQAAMNAHWLLYAHGKAMIWPSEITRAKVPGQSSD